MLAVAIGTLGLAYAAVPLYRMFCQATGFGGTPKRHAGGGEADGAIVNYCDIKLVLCDTLPPRRRVWHARLAAGGFRLFLDRFAKLNRVARCVPVVL